MAEPLKQRDSFDDDSNSSYDDPVNDQIDEEVEVELEVEVIATRRHKRSCTDSIPRPKPGISGRKLKVFKAENGQCYKKQRQYTCSQYRWSLYCVGVSNLDVRGKINMNYLQSNKTYIGVFDVEDLSQCSYINVAVYGPDGRKIADTTTKYGKDINEKSLKTGKFKKPEDNEDEGDLTFRLYQRSRNEAEGGMTMTINRLSIQETNDE